MKNFKQGKKGKPQFKGGKGKSNFRNSKFSKEDQVAERYSKTNDPNWYVSDEQMKKDIARVPFSYAAGKSYNLARYQSSWKSADISQYYIQNPRVTSPGAMVLFTRPSLPKTTMFQDPVNQAGMRLVAFLKHTISASLPYEGPDVMVQVIAMSNVYSFLNFATRLYATPSLVSNLNRYTPQSLIAMQGVNPASLIGNLAEYRRSLNQLIRRAATLAIPANIKYLARTAFMYSNYYTEGTAIQNQLYMYAPAGFWKYSETAGAHLEYVKWIDDTQPGTEAFTNMHLKDWSSVIAFGNSLLEAVLSSDDVVMISANILRAFGDSGILKLALVADEAEITPIFDIGVLEQMANADVLGNRVMKYFGTTGNWDVVQEVGLLDVASRLRFNPQFKVANANVADVEADWAFRERMSLLDKGKHLINTTTTFTDENLVIESTRLKASADFSLENAPSYGALTNTTFTLNTATEVVTRVIYSLFITDAGLTFDGLNAVPTMETFVRVAELYPILLDYENGGEAKYDVYAVHSTLVTNAFKFRPIITMLNYHQGSSGPNDGLRNAILTALDNYALIDKETLTSINEAATYALFNVSVLSSAFKS